MVKVTFRFYNEYGVEIEKYTRKVGPIRVVKPEFKDFYEYAKGMLVNGGTVSANDFESLSHVCIVKAEDFKDSRLYLREKPPIRPEVCI